MSATAHFVLFEDENFTRGEFLTHVACFKCKKFVAIVVSV